MHVAYERKEKKEHWTAVIRGCQPLLMKSCTQRCISTQNCNQVHVGQAGALFNSIATVACRHALFVAPCADHVCTLVVSNISTGLNAIVVAQHMALLQGRKWQTCTVVSVHTGRQQKGSQHSVRAPMAIICCHSVMIANENSTFASLIRVARACYLGLLLLLLQLPLTCSLLGLHRI